MLFGRGAECARVDRLLAATRHGSSAALVISGEPGVGKTSLLHYASDNATPDLRVLSVTGAEAETMFPFAALERLLVPVLEHLPTLPAPQAMALRAALSLGTGERGDRFAVCAATFQLLAAAAEALPILVVVDDAQWLDQSTAEALAFTVRRLRADGIALLAATRDTNGFGDVEMLHLRGFDEAAAAELLTARLKVAPAAEVVRAVTAQLSGNPLALSEIADTLTAEELAGNRPLRLPLPAAMTSDRIFGPRVAALDHQTRRALCVTAVAAGDGLAVVLAALSAQGVSPTTVEVLEGSGLVSFTDGQIRFVHPLLRTAALSDLTAAQLRTLHRDVAAVLPASQEERRAWHLAEAALGLDENAACALERAADLAVRRSGYAGAEAALARATILSADDQARSRRGYAAAEAARLAGHSESALRLLTQCEADTNDPGLRAAIAGTRGRIEMHLGRAGTARAIWEAGATALAEQDPDRAAALLATAAMSASLAGDPSGAIQLAREAIDSAAPDDGNTQLIANFVLGNSLVMIGSVIEGRPYLHSAAKLAQRPAPETSDLGWALFGFLGLVLIGAAPAARVLVDPVVHRLRAEGALGQLPMALYVSALADSKLGHLDSGRTAAAEAADLAVVTGDALLGGPALGCLALLDAQRGDEQACRTHAAESLRLGERTNLRDLDRDALDGLGLLELSLGRPDRAITHLKQANRQYGAKADQPVIGRTSSIDLIEAYTRAGVEVPATLLAQLHTLTELAFAGPLHWRAMGLLADDNDFDTWFVRALQVHARGTSPFDTARTRLCYGERLRRSGRRRDAREHLQAALDTFQRVGARLWAERAASELTAAGQPTQPATHSGIDTLTAQELQVAELAVGGGTNKEIAAQLFLSIKTIEMHLGRVYRKLGVRSRTQLANLLRDRAIA